MGFKDQGYLVKICSWGASVFAYPSMQNNLCGLCGNWDGKESNDIRFRDGTIIAPSPQAPGTSWIDKLIEPKYGNHWEVQDCEGKSGIISSMKRPISPVHVVNPCNATKDEIKVFIQRCNDQGIGHQNKFIDECAFDQCIATKSGDKSLPDKWLAESKKLVMEVEQQNKDTIVYPEEDCSGKCSTRLGSGYCKSKCNLSEDKIGNCLAGGDCSCCRPKIINDCAGKCATSKGSGYCRNTCSDGELSIGNCPGGNCSCCRRIVTPACGGKCSLGKEMGYCSTKCLTKPMEVSEPHLSIIPKPSTCNKGCYCCPFRH